MKEWNKNGIYALLPIYDAEVGNGTELIYEDKRIRLALSAKTSMKKVCRYRGIDLEANNSYFSSLTGKKATLPVVISDEEVYIQVKVRSPIGKDDGAMGYVKTREIKSVTQKGQSVLLKLTNGVEIICKCTVENVHKRIQQAKLIRELYIYRGAEKSSKLQFVSEEGGHRIYILKS